MPKNKPAPNQENVYDFESIKQQELERLLQAKERQDYLQSIPGLYEQRSNILQARQLAPVDDVQQHRDLRNSQLEIESRLVNHIAWSQEAARNPTMAATVETHLQKHFPKALERVQFSRSLDAFRQAESELAASILNEHTPPDKITALEDERNHHIRQLTGSRLFEGYKVKNPEEAEKIAIRSNYLRAAEEREKTKLKEQGLEL